MTKPIIKWAGGKTQLLPKITARLPQFIQKGEPYIYVEPFAGSCAVALNLLDNKTNHNTPNFTIINDINADLITLYQVVKNTPKDLLDELKIIQNDYDKLTDKETKQPYFYEKRDLFNTRELSDIKQASLFMFLNRAGFNGLYRVNKNNGFNVPIGGYKRPSFVFEDLIYQVSELLQDVIILNGDYQQTLNEVQKINTDNLPVFFYFDPPYRPISESSSFTAYAQGDFNDDNQIELANFCKDLDKLGHHWLLSNSDPKNLKDDDNFFDDLYLGFTIDRVKASRSINSNGNGRGQVNEILVRNNNQIKDNTMQNIYKPEHFKNFIDTMNHKGIIQYDYFVNWQKVLNNIEPIEKELNLLNTLIGKEDFEQTLFEIFKEYPKTIKTIPILLAIRDKSIQVLIDKTNFIYQHFDFRQKELTDENSRHLVDFVMKSGLGELIQNKKIKSIPDYCMGVEVGLDSNGRKNRGGTQMENLVESFVAKFCHENNLQYLPQGNAKKIKEHWAMEVNTDKSSRIIDFIIKDKFNKLYFIECNFYNGGGSKLKSTATEYIEMSRFWKEQGIEFIWVTDGKGWLTTKNPLQDYFERGNILLNIEMLKSGILEQIIN